MIKIFFALLLFLLTECAAVAQVDSTWKDEIRSVLARQTKAWNNGDVNGYMQGYWKSDELLFTSSGNVRRGWKVTLEKYKNSYDTREKMGVLKFSDMEFNKLSSTSAWVFGHWELERASDHPHGVFTLILKKFSDGWKIIHDHTSVAE